LAGVELPRRGATAVDRLPTADSRSVESSTVSTSSEQRQQRIHQLRGEIAAASTSTALAHPAVSTSAPASARVAASGVGRPKPDTGLISSSSSREEDEEDDWTQTIEDMEESLIFAVNSSSALNGMTAATPESASCLMYYRSKVWIRNRENMVLRVATRDNDDTVDGGDDDSGSVELGHHVAKTLCTGHDGDEEIEEDEAWQLVPVKAKSAGILPLSRSARARVDTPTPTSSPTQVRYGDNVVLLQLPSRSRALGVCIDTDVTTSKPSYQVRCVPCNSSYATTGTVTAPSSSLQQWTVIRGMIPSGQRGIMKTKPLVVRIGESSVEQAKQKQDGATKTPGPASDRKRKMPAAAVVVSGDPVLLRNVRTGFLLSLSSKAGLTLITDSYDSSIIAEQHGRGAGYNRTALMDRLQTHDLYIPSDREIFHVTLGTVPTSTPFWIASRLDERRYLEGSYLFDQERNKSSPDSIVDDVLFGRSTIVVDGLHDADVISAEELQNPTGQQRALCDELLASFLGLEGRFIRASPSNKIGFVEFQLREGAAEAVSFNPSLKSLVTEMLPLSSSFVNVRHFVSSMSPGYEFGSVMQALCEQLDAYLHEYCSVFVKNLDDRYRQQEGKEGLISNLTQLQVNVRPAIHQVTVLQNVVEVARLEKGGSLLNALRRVKQRLDGDAVASHVLGRLLDGAAVPYMKMLRHWMRCGTLNDPYEEFMIRKSSVVGGSWEDSYSLAQTHILDGFFSSRKTVVEIFATGRYWNAIRACQEIMRHSDLGKGGYGDDDFPVPLYSCNAASVAARVQATHQRASRLLVRLLLDEFALIDSLRIVKRYLLLEQGDFFVNFMDFAEDELLKEISSVSHGSIQHWLNTAVLIAEHRGERGLALPPSPRRSANSSVTALPHLSPTKLQSHFEAESLLDYFDSLYADTGGIDTKEAPTPLRHAYGDLLPDSLTGLGAFVIDFSPVPFPISLVLDSPTMANYRLLFRHLFHAKYIERRLVGVWQDQQAFRELQSLRGALGPTFLLRQRMLHFLQNLVYYMMVEVIEPNWLELEKSVWDCAAKDRTVDDIIHVHSTFLRKSLEACLLTNRDLLRSLTKLLSTCLLFSDQMKKFMEATKVEDDKRLVATEKRRAIQRNLNDRGGVRVSLSRKRTEEALRNDLQARSERVKQQTARVRREITSDSYQRMIQRFDQVFSEHLSDFMVRLKYSDAAIDNKLNLCSRLDYNGYLSRALGLTKSK